ncbi:hypothetical protein D3C73_719590 [compost metagenome]
MLLDESFQPIDFIKMNIIATITNMVSNANRLLFEYRYRFGQGAMLDSLMQSEHKKHILKLLVNN